MEASYNPNTGTVYPVVTVEGGGSDSLMQYPAQLETGGDGIIYVPFMQTCTTDIGNAITIYFAEPSDADPVIPLISGVYYDIQFTWFNSDYELDLNDFNLVFNIEYYIDSQKIGEVPFTDYEIVDGIALRFTAPIFDDYDISDHQDNAYVIMRFSVNATVY